MKFNEFDFIRPITEKNINEVLEDCHEAYYECDDDATRTGMWSDIEQLEILKKSFSQEQQEVLFVWSDKIEKGKVVKDLGHSLEIAKGDSYYTINKESTRYL